MTIRGIFFDAGDVLYYRSRPTEEYAADLLREGGHTGELSAEQRASLRSLRAQAFTARLGAGEYWDQFLLMHGVADPDERRVLSGLIDAYSDQVLPIPGAQAVLETLKQRGFLLGIVTDTMYPMERKMGWLRHIGVADLVDVVVCSTVLGARKPDLAMYLSAVRQAHLTPEESAFVGHSARELAGAHRAGMATVAVNYYDGAQADHYAQSLPDLLQVPIFADSHGSPRVKDMTRDIQAIFIDVGNTLRVLVEDEAYQAEAKKQIATLVGTEEPPEVFCRRLDERYKVYRKWAFETLREASERDLWTQWMLPEAPAEAIGPLSGELTFLYRQTMGRRFAQPDAKPVVVELTKRGYRLGILSNTITEREIPRWLEEDGLSQYFPAVVLSSIFGHRKPGPEIYWEAARQAGVEPAHAAYVADNPSRDVPGSRRAGFGMFILMGSPEELAQKDLTGENKPDLVIHTLSELLDVFPPRADSNAG